MILNKICTAGLLYCFTIGIVISQNTKELHINGAHELKKYIQKKDSSKSVIIRETSVDEIYEGLVNNVNKGYIHSLSIYLESQERIDKLYLNLEDYVLLRSLEIVGTGYDTFDVRTIEPLPRLDVLSLAYSNFKNYPEIIHYLTNFDSLSYLSLNSKYIDSILFPSPELKSLSFYYISGSFKNIPPIYGQYNSLVSIHFKSDEEIEFIPPEVIRTYQKLPKLALGAHFQLDVPIPIRKYLEQMYDDNRISFFSSKHETATCNCYKIERREYCLLVTKKGRCFGRYKTEKKVDKREMHY